VVNDGGLKLLFKERHEVVPNAGAHTVRVTVGGVFPPGLALAAKIGAQIRAADSEKRAQHNARGGMDAGKSGESRATQNVRQHGFRLIVGRVRDGDAIEAALLYEALKEGVSRPPRYIFQIAAFALGPRGDVFRGHEKFQTVLRREPRDEFLVELRSPAAQFVIEVHHAQDAAQPLPQFQEQMQQGDGIRAAGNSNAQALSGAEQINLFEEDQKPLGELISPGRTVLMRCSLHWERCR